MYTKRFVESVRMMHPESLTIQQITTKLQKWSERGHPVKVENIGLFYNGYTTFYNTIEELAHEIFDLALLKKINYFTIAIIDKTFEE